MNGLHKLIKIGKKLDRIDSTLGGATREPLMPYDLQERVELMRELAKEVGKTTPPPYLPGIVKGTLGGGLLGALGGAALELPRAIRSLDIPKTKGMPSLKTLGLAEKKIPSKRLATMVGGLAILGGLLGAASRGIEHSKHKEWKEVSKMSKGELIHEIGNLQGFLAEEAIPTGKISPDEMALLALGRKAGRKDWEYLI